MKINLTTQTIILSFSDADLDVNEYLYKYFDEELKKNPTTTNIKTLAYNEESDKLVLLIFDKENGFTQKKITLENV